MHILRLNSLLELDDLQVLLKKQLMVLQQLHFFFISCPKNISRATPKTTNNKDNGSVKFKNFIISSHLSLKYYANNISLKNVFFKCFILHLYYKFITIIFYIKKIDIYCFFISLFVLKHLFFTYFKKHYISILKIHTIYITLFLKTKQTFFYF